MKNTKTQQCISERHIALTEGKKTVFHTLRFCNQVRREFLFTFDSIAITGESRDAMTGRFDARDLPAEYRDGNKPVDWIRKAIQADFDFSKITW